VPNENDFWNDPAEAGSLGSLHVPLNSVVENRILSPDSKSLLLPNSLKKVGSTGPGPLNPFVNVAMMYWVVMNIVDTGPEVALRSNHPIEASIPNLPASCLALAIPFEGGATMESSKFLA